MVSVLDVSHFFGVSPFPVFQQQCGHKVWGHEMTLRCCANMVVAVLRILFLSKEEIKESNFAVVTNWTNCKYKSGPFRDPDRADLSTTNEFKVR